MKKNGKVLICGDRAYADYDSILAFLKSYYPSCVVHGAAPGADSLAGKAAKELQIPVKDYPADWDKYNRAAGPIRNTLMLKDNPDIDLVVAFHDDIENSKGTKHMVNIAHKNGIKTLLFEKKK